MVPSTGLTGNTTGDFEYSNALNNVFKDTSQLDSDALLAADRAKADYKDLYTRAADAYTKNRKASKNSFSGRGMLYSGAYAQDQGDLAKDNVDNVNNIAKQSQRFYEDVTRQSATRKAAADKAKLDIETQQSQVKAQMDLQKALIEAQAKQYANAQAALVSNANNNTVGVDAAGVTQVEVQTATQDSSYFNNLSPQDKYWWIFNNRGPEAAAAYAQNNG
jgi:predicted RNA binding protein with dsRBD fold (UPF0201 family)